MPSLYQTCLQRRQRLIHRVGQIKPQGLFCQQWLVRSFLISSMGRLDWLHPTSWGRVVFRGLVTVMEHKGVSSQRPGLVLSRRLIVSTGCYPQWVCICQCVSAFSDLVDMNLTLFISLLSNKSSLTKFENPSLTLECLVFFFSPLACNFVTFHCWLSE